MNDPWTSLLAAAKSVLECHGLNGAYHERSTHLHTLRVAVAAAEKALKDDAEWEADGEDGKEAGMEGPAPWPYRSVQELLATHRFVRDLPVKDGVP
jgi:hypothetical protein